MSGLAKLSLADHQLVVAATGVLCPGVPEDRKALYGREMAAAVEHANGGHPFVGPIVLAARLWLLDTDACRTGARRPPRGVWANWDLGNALQAFCAWRLGRILDEMDRQAAALEAQTESAP